MSISSDDYSDIIDHPRHISDVHPQMPIAKRASQFAAFAALSGYEELVDDTAKLAYEQVIAENLNEAFDE